MKGTKLVGKEMSPLVIRRYSVRGGSPCFVALITDDNLDNLDDVVLSYIEQNPLPETLQGLRNWAGLLTKHLCDKFPKTEGCAVILYADKAVISSLSGDFMHHTPCRLELYSLLCFMTNI